MTDNIEYLLRRTARPHALQMLNALDAKMAGIPSGTTTTIAKQETPRPVPALKIFTLKNAMHFWPQDVAPTDEKSQTADYGYPKEPVFDTSEDTKKFALYFWKVEGNVYEGHVAILAALIGRAEQYVRDNGNVIP